MAGNGKTLKDYMDDAKKKASSGGYGAGSASVPGSNPTSVNDYMNQAVASVMPANPYASLNQDVLYRVGQTWRDGWYYQLNDQEDLARKNAGKMPKYYDSQYDLSNEYDRYLYQNNLPPQSTLNKSYSKVEQTMADEQAKARKDAAEAASKRAAEAAKAAEEEAAAAALLPPSATQTKTTAAATPATAETAKTPVAKGAHENMFKQLFGGQGGRASYLPTTEANAPGVGVGIAPTNQPAGGADAVLTMLGNLFGRKQQGAVPAADANMPAANGNASPVKDAKEGVGIGISPSTNKRSDSAEAASKLAGYMNLANQADFAEKAAPGAGNLNSTYLGPIYRYVNNLQGMRTRVSGTGGNAFDLVVGAMGGADVALARQGMGQMYANQYLLYDQMTPEEVDVLNYTVATRGEREAKQYMKLLEPTLTDRLAGETAQVAEDLSKNPVLGSIASVPLNAASAMEGAITMLAGIGGEQVSANDRYRGATRVAMGIRDKISGQMTPVGSFFYQTGMSMLDTAFRLPFGNAGLAIAGFNSASQTAQQSIEDGASTEQALWLAGISGSLEAITEKWSLGNLREAKISGTLTGIIKETLLQGGIEASEEAASAIGNLTADILFRKEDSAWNQEVLQYMRAGMTREEANKKTFISQAMQVLSQAAGGFFSGIFFGSGGQIFGNYTIGQQQGAKGAQAVGKGMQTVAAYDNAVAAYKQAMKTTPRYTPEERIAIARDIEASGLSSANKDGIAAMIDHYAMQPDGWITERGQELTEQAIQATRQAAEKGYVATAQMEAKQTRALERLNTMFSDIQAAYQESENAIKSGDLAAHTKAVQATTAAIAKYNAAFNTEQADMKAQKAQRDADQRAAAETVSAVARKLQAQLPAEVENHVQLANQIEAQAAPAIQANVSPAAQPQVAPMESMPTAVSAAQAAEAVAETAQAQQSEPERVMLQSVNSLTTTDDPAVWNRAMAEYQPMFVRYNGINDWIEPTADPAFSMLAALKVGDKNYLVPSYYDTKLAGRDVSIVYDIEPLPDGVRAKAYRVDKAAEIEPYGNYFKVISKGRISLLTSLPTTGNVSAKSTEAPAGGTFDMVGSVMKNASAVPVYKQQSAPTRGNPDVDVTKYMLNGGKPNGGSGENTVLAGQTVSGLRQSGADNGSGSVEADRFRTQAAGRNGGSAGRGGSDGTDARGGQVPAGGVWNEVTRGDLTQATASINEELARAGIDPLAEGDLIPVETLDQESAYWLKRMESLSGRKALIYRSKSGRLDVKNGFANNGREHVRYQPGRIMAFHFAHEIAENSARIRAAGEKVLNAIGNDSFKNYLRVKDAENADAETQKALRKEFICDAYGAVMFEIVAKTSINEQLGIGSDDYAEFQKAYIDHLASPAISEETLDKETRSNMRGSAYSSTNVEDPLEQAVRAGITPATREEALTLLLTNPRNMMRYRADVDAVFQETFPQREEVLLGMPPKVLLDNRMTNRPLYITQSTMWKIAFPSGHQVNGVDVGGKHNLGVEVLKQLPEQLENPLAITNNTLSRQEKNDRDSIVVWTDWMTDSGKGIIVPITIDANGSVGLENRVGSLFVSGDKYLENFKKAGVLYTRNGKDIDQLATGRRLVPAAEVNDVFTSIIADSGENVKGNGENSQFSIKGKTETEFSSTEVADPQTDPYAAAAYQLYNEGVTYESYMSTPDADWRVGKQLNGLWNGVRKIRVMQRALDLFENKVTPAQYWEQNKTHWGKEGDQDTQVLNQLYGMYLRNDVPMGGRLGEGEGGQLETLLKDIGNARQFHQMTLSGKSPARLFEDLPSYRKNNSLGNQMKNYRDGEMMRETYFDYLMNHNASRAAYMKGWHDKVQAAFKGGSVRESNLAQLLGERIVDKENLKQAIYDGNHMLVRAIDGWFVFEHSGRLLAFCDGETTFFRDPNADKARKAANKASTEAKTPSQKARERLKEKFTQGGKGAVIRVDRKGNNAVIYIPGIRNPVQIQNGKAPNAEIAIRTADALTEYYAQAWQDQSRVLVENGYAPAKFIPDYFPHIWQEESGLNGVIEAFVGYEPPTQIAGLTGGFKPGKPWAAHLQERTGPLTEFDAIRGFNQYVQKAGDVIFMTPAVQRLRQLESYLRTNAGEKFDATAHSTFVEWLRKYTNEIANKKAELDRSAESLFGHEAFSISSAATTLISRSAVQGSLSSAISQTISYIAALPTLNARSAVKGTRQAIIQTMLAMTDSKYYDKFEEKVPFLQSRFGAYEEILTKDIQKADKITNGALSWLFTAMDRFATEAVARAKFDELRMRGKSEEEAGRETSAYCVKLFADRSKGMAPVVFNNKVLKPFFQFQLEVANQMQHFRDIKRVGIGETYDLLTNPDMEERRARQGITEDMVAQLLGDQPLSLEATKVAKKIAASGSAKKWIRMLMYLVYLSLWGEFTRAVMGRDQTWNPYGMTKDFIQDVKSDGVPAAVVNLGANAIEQLPYASFATGGRVPIGAGIDKFATVAEDVLNGIKEGDWQGLGRHAIMAGLAVTPSGGQMRKIGTGIEANTKQGYYTDKGQLRYPVTSKDYVKTILFGPSAAAPDGYDWNDTLSAPNTEAYKSMVAAGYDPQAAYQLLLNYGTSNAEKGLAILTTDSNGDGKPDFQGKDVNIIARMLGIKYDSAKDGSFQDWTKNAAKDYIEKVQKDGATPAQQKKVDDIQRMMQIMLGMN